MESTNGIARTKKKNGKLGSVRLLKEKTISKGKDARSKAICNALTHREINIAKKKSLNLLNKCIGSVHFFKKIMRSKSRPRLSTEIRLHEGNLVVFE